MALKVKCNNQYGRDENNFHCKNQEDLERIKGIKNGGDRKSDENYFHLPTQEDLANELQMTQRQLGNYKRLTTLIPELQELSLDNSISTSVASRVLARCIIELERIKGIKHGNNQFERSMLNAQSTQLLGVDVDTAET